MNPDEMQAGYCILALEINKKQLLHLHLFKMNYVKAG